MVKRRAKQENRGGRKKLRSYTWRELETNGKFAKNDKLSFVTDDLLIVGYDIGSETHYISEIVSYAEKRVGLTDGTDVGREAVKWYAEQILKLDEQLASVESTLHRKCREIPYAENILEINGVGENILSGILAEMCDISRFDDVREIQKLSGMGLVACSSGKHKGQTKISHRGRRDFVTGCFRQQSQQCRMRMNLNNCMSITQRDPIIH